MKYDVRDISFSEADMFDSKINKEHLIQRRDEILRQLGQLEAPIHEELDRNADEQAIQLEQTDVTLSVVDGLNRELRQIEEMLLEYEAG